MTKPLAIAIVAAILGALLALAAHGVMPGLLGVIATSGPAPDLVVTGTLVPDATGDYFEGPEYAGYPTYDMEAYIIYLSTDGWAISTATDFHVINGWLGPNQESPIGEYLPQGTATGTATVSAP